jgi:hypothetical protein
MKLIHQPSRRSCVSWYGLIDATSRNFEICCESTAWRVAPWKSWVTHWRAGAYSRTSFACQPRKSVTSERW